jgi:hypothetical protein
MTPSEESDTFSPTANRPSQAPSGRDASGSMLRRTRFIDRLGQVRGFLIVVLLAVLVVTLVALALTRDVRGR